MKTQGPTYVYIEENKVQKEYIPPPKKKVKMNLNCCMDT